MNEPVRAAIAAAILCPTSALAGELTFASGFSEPAVLAALEEIIADFEAEHPDIDVTLNTVEQEAFKLAVRNWLTTRAPDVITWAASERLFNLVDLGLIEDVSDLWAEEGLNETMAGTRNAVTREGAQYALPISGVTWRGGSITASTCWRRRGSTSQRRSTS